MTMRRGVSPSSDRSTKRAYFLLSVPALTLYSFFFLIPALSGIFYSLTDWNGITQDYNLIGFENYAKILTDPRFYNALKFTARYTLLTMVCLIPLTLGLALLLNSGIRGTGAFRSLFFFPAVLSLLTVGLIFNQIFYRPLPLIGQALGIEALSTNILGNPKLAIYGILLTSIWQSAAMPTVIFLAGLQSVPRQLYEAGVIDGCGPWQKFRSITLPFLMPMLTINLVTVLSGGLTVFDYIAAMTDGGPGRATESIGVMIYKLGFKQYKFAYGATLSVLLLLLIVVLSAIQIHLLSKREAGQQ